MPRFCSSCGSPLPDVGKFCPKCGQPIDAEPVPQPEAYQQQPEQYQNQYTYQPEAPQDPGSQQPQNSYWQPQDQGWQQPQNQGWQQPQNSYWQQPQEQGWQQPQEQGWQQPQEQGWQQPQEQGWQQSAAAGGMAPAPKKKSKAGLIVGLVFLLLAALAAVACFVWPGFLNQSSNDTPETTANASAPVSTPENTETVPPVTTTVPVTETEATEPTTTEALVTEPVNPFLDITEDDPCYPEFLWAHDHGVIEGDRLNGDHILTRGDAINLLWKAFGRPAAAQDASPFTDVSVSDSFYPAVLWAFGNGLVSGNGDGTFGPNDNMTRDQAAAILCKAAGGNGTNLPRAYLDTDPSQYFYPAVNWGCSAGVIERYYDFSFRPGDPMLQADFLCWLARTVEPELALDPAPPEGDSLDEYGVEIDLHQHGVAYFNAQANNDASVTKRLSVTAESYEIFAQAEGYPAQEGYEWRKAVFLIDYGDADASSYHYDLFADVNDSYYVNLFEDCRAYHEDNSETSWVIWNGVPYEIYVSPMFAEQVEGKLYRVSFAVRVPVGYDGIVARFNSKENEPASGLYFYEQYTDPANFVFFRYE